MRFETVLQVAFEPVELNLERLAGLGLGRVGQLAGTDAQVVALPLGRSCARRCFCCGGPGLFELLVDLRQLRHRRRDAARVCREFRGIERRLPETWRVGRPGGLERGDLGHQVLEALGEVSRFRRRRVVRHWLGRRLAARAGRRRHRARRAGRRGHRGRLRATVRPLGRHRQAQGCQQFSHVFAPSSSYCSFSWRAPADTVARRRCARIFLPRPRADRPTRSSGALQRHFTLRQTRRRLSRATTS